MSSSATTTQPPIARVWVGEGQGIATSGYGRRRWQNGDGRPAHHLIDPETGVPWLRTHATVISDDPVAADVLAKLLTLRPGRIAALDEAGMVIERRRPADDGRMDGEVAE